MVGQASGVDAGVVLESDPVAPSSNIRAKFGSSPPRTHRSSRSHGTPSSPRTNARSGLVVSIDIVAGLPVPAHHRSRFCYGPVAPDWALPSLRRRDDVTTV